MEKDNILLKDVIQYNKDRRLAFLNYQPFVRNKDFEKLLCARYMKNTRIKKHLLYMIVHRKYLYFCTFTFSDTYINRSSRSKRDLIKHSINTFDDDVLFILNIDYGKVNEREHFHAIIGTNNSNSFRKHLKNTYPFFTSCDSINTSSDDIKRLTKYINKLSNHTTKDTTYNKRIVYNFKGWNDTFFYNLAKSYLLDVSRS